MIEERSNRRQALLVLGMHRSGTSVLTRTINLHGVPLGSELPDAAFDNPAGFWENQHVVRFHERLLQELDSSWDDPRELREGWFEEPGIAPFLDELVTLIASEFGDAAIWAVKDPRSCRLLPLWLAALGRLNVEAKLIFAIRSPDEVVGSLMQRNRLPAGSASLMWLRHLLEPMQASHGVRRCVVDYTEILQDWRGCMARIARDLDITWPVSSSDCAREVDAHVRDDLRHQRSERTKDLLPTAWKEPLLQIYGIGQAVAVGRAQWTDLELTMRAFFEQLEFARPLLIKDLQPASIYERLRDQLMEAEAGKEAYRAEAARLSDRLNVEHEQLVLARNKHDTELKELAATQLAEREELIATHHVEREQLVQARGEIAKSKARILQLERENLDLQMIKASRSWRWTRPMRVAMRVLRHKGLGDADRVKLQKLLRAGANLASTDQAGSSEMAGIHLLPQAAGHRDVYVWSVIDWHFRIQRPQHLSRELALGGSRVFYISNRFIDSDQPGFAVEPLDASGRLFQVRLHLSGGPEIYHAVPTPDAQEQLRASTAELLAWVGSRSCLSLVQHPYWLETARVLPNQRLIYDCMDHHGGFADNSAEVLARELELMRTADLLVVTSDWLYEEAGKQNPHKLMIRNACQYEHFAARPDEVFEDEQGRRVIGYYGAIAEWFDVDLLEKVAQRFSDCLVLMVGADTINAQQQLRHLPNIRFTGEVPYAKLPFYLYAFDVCTLPFQIIPLTLATNPVKIYEYLSAGKEVVSIMLPEIRQFGDLVRTGHDHATFIEAVGAALSVEPDPFLIERRRKFAAEQTWAHRAYDLIRGLDSLAEPRVSVVVVTYNNIELTKACLHSIERYSDYSNLEIIVVDNASSDGTQAFLASWAMGDKSRRVIYNEDNRGFAAANNQGLEAATGDYLVLLNNDTYVTPGWVATLVAHLRKTKTLGLIGPVTNNIGNEARIDISYSDMDGMLKASSDYTLRHLGMLTPLHTAAFFCVMMPRVVYETVGPLDEAFGIGFFEDDDYCRRVEQAGWSIACADDVFIHHHLSASFDKLKQEKRQALFEGNRAIYEAKWGPWVPHGYRVKS